MKISFSPSSSTLLLSQSVIRFQSLQGYKLQAHLLLSKVDFVQFHNYLLLAYHNCVRNNQVTKDLPVWQFSITDSICSSSASLHIHRCTRVPDRLIKHLMPVDITLCWYNRKLHSLLLKCKNTDGTVAFIVITSYTTFKTNPDKGNKRYI